MKINTSLYQIKNPDEIESPALVYYEDIIRNNTALAIKTAGGAARLWPHVKTHKMQDMIRLQMEMGIKRFKCATIAEAEMLAACEVEDILLAYPLVGPNIARFQVLVDKYPHSRFWAIGDDLQQLALLEKCFAGKSSSAWFLVDVNLGMNRTGVPLDRLEEFSRQCAALGKGLSLKGFHCYDGHNNDPGRRIRDESAGQSLKYVKAIREKLKTAESPLDIMVMGGTPSFPCYAAYPDVFLSPGTLFINDYGYASKYADMDYIPGAAVMSRVVSHPSPGIFTLDAGSKALAADPLGIRGVIAGYENDAEPIFQSEEHWVFRLKENSMVSIPPIGTVLYVIPTHICPTSALYPSGYAVKDKKIAGTWDITARNRKINY